LKRRWQSTIHPKAMPVILTTAEEVDLWLAADAPKALELQRPLSDDALRIVASGERQDGLAKGIVPFALDAPRRRN
jgi:putative SOS response-associated peptidase YedK